jgi:ankyrin repeat protein
MPIHRASIRGLTEVVVALVNGGADPNAPDYEGYTPLHFAAKGGHYETAEVLYRAGGDPLKTNEFIFTPLDFAQRFRFDDIVQLLNTPRAKLPSGAASTRETPKSGSASLRQESERGKSISSSDRGLPDIIEE